MNPQRESNKYFSSLAKNNKINKTEKVGRYKLHANLEKKIFNDIIKKLNLKKNDKLLDIGCGCGTMVDRLVRYCKKKKINITLCDINAVLKISKKKYSNNKNIKFLVGEFQKKKFKQKFDKILCYSVIQYSNNPRNFFEKILRILNHDGKALIGDIPNINKKYRFLKSEFGKKFEEKRLKRKINIKSFKKFKKTKNHYPLINDGFSKYILNLCHKNNRNCLILKQPKKLPFSFTREDILVEEF